MSLLRRSKEFDTWLRNLSDTLGKAKIINRLARAEDGNFGDCDPVGGGVSEMKFKGAGPGYRIYFTRRGNAVIWLLIGGDKNSQKRDIKQAKKIARDLKDNDL